MSGNPLSVYDNKKGMWRRKFNQELWKEFEMASIISFIRGQRIQWLGHIVQKVDTVLKWKLTGKIPRVAPEKDG